MDKAKINPVETVRNNVLGNTILLDAAHKNKIKRYIFASSIYVYSHLGSFYRASKQACELFIESYHEAYLLRPKDSKVNFQIAFILASVGFFDEALQHIEVSCANPFVCSDGTHDPAVFKLRDDIKELKRKRDAQKGLHK